MLTLRFAPPPIGMFGFTVTLSAAVPDTAPLLFEFWVIAVCAAAADSDASKPNTVTADICFRFVIFELLRSPKC